MHLLHNNSALLFRSVFAWLYCTCLYVFLFIFHANFDHFIPDNYDLVGVGGADGGAGAWGGRGGTRGECGKRRGVRLLLLDC